MISVTRLNNSRIFVNADLIQVIESTPDTVITLTSGAKLIVKEPPELLIERVIEYQRLVHNPQLASHNGE